VGQQAPQIVFEAEGQDHVGLVDDERLERAGKRHILSATEKTGSGGRA